MSQVDSKTASYRTPALGLSHEGAQAAHGRRFALVAARFNAETVERLIAGAREALRDAGATEADVELFRCPGAMELAGLARRIAEGGRFDGIICLGAIIRGGTPHFDLVAESAAREIGALSAKGRIPVAFGVLACDTLEQARERSGPDKKENRGYDAAMVAVEMADLYARLEVGVALAPAPDIPRRTK
ncbi:MAG TPA: 6,7-dimethyl-8-ribityllumazine synthase [Polyangia bacterium]|nr:6,7-dimethyl-8-ribityllumazine synthase [Polyangia bacterium]